MQVSQWALIHVLIFLDLVDHYVIHYSNHPVLTFIFVIVVVVKLLSQGLNIMISKAQFLVVFP